jgi:hypothetical protein
MPAPPQVCPIGQKPQSITPPHPSPTRSQYCEVAVGLQEFLVQFVLPQTLAMPAAPHASPAGHAAQVMEPPHPLPMVPQYWPLVRVQVCGVQAPLSGFAPQVLAMPPPPQVNPALVQSPQSSCRPQPSPILPQ